MNKSSTNQQTINQQTRPTSIHNLNKNSGRSGLNKQMLINALVKLGELNEYQAGELVFSIFEQVSNALARGEEVKIANLGRFFTSESKARIGRNPQTGASIQIPARRRVMFRPAKQLKLALNQQPMGHLNN